MANNDNIGENITQIVIPGSPSSPCLLHLCKRIISEKYGVPIDDFYLVCNGRKLSNDDDLRRDMGAPIRIVLRVLGGKGGFGSMLRAIGAQIEKTTNREACRDLSGRRIRDINEERKLKNWISQKEQREKEAKERKKKRLERLCEEPKVEFDDKDYDLQRSGLTETISEAVEQGMKAGPGPSGIGQKRIGKSSTENKIPPKKRFKGLLFEIDADDISSSDSTDEDETISSSEKLLTVEIEEKNGIDCIKIRKENKGQLGS